MKEINSLAQMPSSGTALLYIGTDWCTFCQKTTTGIEQVRSDYPYLDILKIDGDEEPDILDDVNAKSYPQLLLYRDGEKVAQRESADGPTLKQWLAEHGVS